MKKVESTNNSNRIHNNQVCPLAFALSKINSRWKPLIVQKMQTGPMRFGQIRLAIPVLTERMLTLSLKELEQDGLILRKDYQVYPKMVEYSLSESGQSLSGTLNQLAVWAQDELTA